MLLRLQDATWLMIHVFHLYSSSIYHITNEPRKSKKGLKSVFLEVVAGICCPVLEVVEEPLSQQSYSIQRFCTRSFGTLFSLVNKSIKIP